MQPTNHQLCILSLKPKLCIVFHATEEIQILVCKVNLYAVKWRPLQAINLRFAYDISLTQVIVLLAFDSKI